MSAVQGARAAEGQEGALGGGGAVAHLGRGLASALTNLALRTRVAEWRDGADEFGHPVRGNQLGEGLVEEIPQDGRGMVAGAEVAQGVERIVGTLTARGAEPKAEGGKGAGIHQAGLDRERAGGGGG